MVRVLYAVPEQPRSSVGWSTIVPCTGLGLGLNGCGSVLQVFAADVRRANRHSGGVMEVFECPYCHRWSALQMDYGLLREAVSQEIWVTLNRDGTRAPPQPPERVPGPGVASTRPDRRRRARRPEGGGWDAVPRGMLNPFPDKEEMIPVEDQMVPVNAVLNAIEETADRLEDATEPLRGLSRETEAAALRYCAKHGKGAKKQPKKASKRTPKKSKTAWDHIANSDDDATS